MGSRRIRQPLIRLSEMPPARSRGQRNSGGSASSASASRGYDSEFDHAASSYHSDSTLDSPLDNSPLIRTGNADARATTVPRRRIRPNLRRLRRIASSSEGSLSPRVVFGPPPPPRRRGTPASARGAAAPRVRNGVLAPPNRNPALAPPPRRGRPPAPDGGAGAARRLDSAAWRKYGTLTLKLAPSQIRKFLSIEGRYD